jgi:hypothetical protein
MRIKLIALLIIVAIPATIAAQVLYVPQDVPTLEEAAALVDSDDTLVVSEDLYFDAMAVFDEDVEIIVDDLEPPDATHDSAAYGPRFHMPASPVE